MSNNSKTTPRRVDWFLHDDDYECAYLGSLGFSTRYIMRMTKLTSGKITYRLKKAAIRRIDYRDGNSDLATLVQRNMRGTIQNAVTKYLKGL